jgi:hypothetical protein
MCALINTVNSCKQRCSAACQSICMSVVASEKQDGTLRIENDDKEPSPVVNQVATIGVSLIALIFIVKILYRHSS